ITAGTLYLGKDENSRGVLDGCLKLDGMIPGETPREFKLTVKNIGNLKAYLNGLSASVKESDSKFMANAIRATCVGPGGEKFYSGSLLALDNNAVPTESEIALEPGEEKVLVFTFQLDRRAGNWYKGKSIEVSLTVYAGQNPGQGLKTNVLVAGKNLQAAVDQAAPGTVILVPAGEYGKLQIKNSDIAIKAKDVVYDTVLAGVVFGGQVHEVSLQGFTVDGAGREELLVIPGSARNISLKDNIFQNAGSGANLAGCVQPGRSAGLVVQRNDFSSVAGVSGGEERTGTGKFAKPGDQ
ncbi:MAG: hypothetical protein H5T99_08380, partial [Moorella sp. (in: Bacteria)]|nr:hypothetical protein [Moorella sp. (in: firmicutes)]